MNNMRAMILERPNSRLVLHEEMPVPEPSTGELLVKVEACGVCRTDLHIIDGELEHPHLPLVPGHEVVGRVVEARGTEEFKPGDRVGIPWLGGTCGECTYCKAARENLCDSAVFTGYTRNGGYAEYCCSDSRYTFHLPENYDASHAAPLLCAGLIGYRSLSLALEAPCEVKNIGLYGFGAAAHIICQVCTFQGRRVFAFTRDGDRAKQEFARSLGAVWAGGSGDMPPEPLDAAIIFAPVGSLVPAALKAVRKGGRVVCAGIYMSTIPAFSYDDLWWEKQIVSVANLTRRDGMEFMKLAEKCNINMEVTTFPLERANEAVDAVRRGQIRGAAVLVI